QYDPLEPNQIMAGVGTYRGSSAIGLGLAHYTNESTMIHAGMAYSGGDGHIMANAGITWKYGYKADETAIADRYRQGPISSAYALQDEVSALKERNDRLEARNAELEAKVNLLMEKMGVK
ncbi:MAG: YadA-like family protein, partial [Veillonella sp.]|nr:YadA-like family protein [Veillonella sp.]